MFLWLFLSCSAILSLTRVCTLFFFPPAIFYFLFFMIWHVVLMQSKTGACGCECSIFQSLNDSVCVCVYVWMRRREQFTEVIGSPPVLWLHNIWAGSAVVLHSLNFFFCAQARKHTGTVWVFLDFTLGFFFPQVCFYHCNRLLLCLYHCCFILVNTSMYIPRPKHLQIQVTHGTHL